MSGQPNWKNARAKLRGKIISIRLAALLTKATTACLPSVSPDDVIFILTPTDRCHGAHLLKTMPCAMICVRVHFPGLGTR